MSTMIRTYKELISIPDYMSRFEYLKLVGAVGVSTFGFDRYLNQSLYRSKRWRSLRNEIIVRDNGCDMAFEDNPILGNVIVHHMNPITIEMVEDDSEDLYNPDWLVCVSKRTHNAIHFGDADLLSRLPIDRKPGDTCPWK